VYVAYNSKKNELYLNIIEIHMENIINTEESFETVSVKLANMGYVIKHNSNDTLYMISSDDENDKYTGYIFEKETNKIICYGQRKVEDIDNKKLHELLNKKEINNKTIYSGGLLRMEYCEDGTLMRLYNYNDEWYTATTNCTDARKSYWASSISFSDMFWGIFNEKTNTDLLDKNSTYYFILLHNENRLVVNHVKNNLVFLCKVNESGEDYKDIYEKKFWRPVMIKSLDINNINQSFWDKKRGIILKFKDDDKIYKIDFEIYKEIKSIRGNNPNIEMRYIELINDDFKRNLLKLYYPEHTKLINKVHKLYYDFIYHIHQLYLETHIKHTKVIDKTHTYFPLIKSLHAQYKRTRNVILYKDVKEKIEKMHINIIKDLFKKLELPN